jgi:hypothetical protein
VFVGGVNVTRQTIICTLKCLSVVCSMVSAVFDCSYSVIFIAVNQGENAQICVHTLS